jgi:universal stress protein E
MPAESVAKSVAESAAERQCPLHLSPRRRIARILVVVDPTADTHPCVEKAARLALGCGATLELFVCDVHQENDAAERTAREDRALGMLQQLARDLRPRGLEVDCRCEWHAPLEIGIGLRAIRTNADLVVKDTHRHALTALGGGYGLTDWTLIRQLAVPLLLVRPEPWPPLPRITVSVDPCHPAQRPESLDESMVELASEFANALRGVVDALHVLQSPPHLPGDTVPAAAREAAHERARGAVVRLLARCNTGGNPVDLHFVAGKVAPSVLGFTATRGTHLLVMGSGAHSRWLQTGASGTAAHVLESLTCDLLVVRPPGYVSPLLVTDE